MSKHSVLAPDTITILISDRHAPDCMPPNADGSCTLILRLFGIMIEDLCYLSLGPLNEKGVNWEDWKTSGVSELLIKCMDQGKRVARSATPTASKLCSASSMGKAST